MTTTTRRSGVFASLVALAWAGLGVGAAEPAAAHTELTSASPANGAVVGIPPKTARLVFNEQVSPVASGIALRSSNGTKVATGEAYRSASAVVVPIEETLAPGGYLLSYKVTSADGHNVAGTIAFRVKG
ncbi:MAG: copper resistance CopC family protein [Sporichthyaceae bacterium]